MGDSEIEGGAPGRQYEEKLISPDFDHENLLGSAGSASSSPNIGVQGKQHWAFSSFITVGYILGTGVLVLPSAMSSLGYVVGVFVCVFFALLSTYIGLILGRIRNNFYPNCVSYKSLSKACCGDRFEYMLEFLTCINWFMSMALYILTAVESFQAAFPNTSMCGYDWGLICVAIMIPAMAITDMKSIEWFAAISDAAAIIIIIFVLSAIATQGSTGSHTHNVWPPAESFLEAYNPISSFIFAYQGQSIFLEIMSEMRKPTDWPKSVFASHSGMFTCYCLTAVVGYYYIGDDVPAFLPKALKDGLVKTIVNLLIAYHVLVAYIINSVPLTGMLKRRYMQGANTPFSRHFLLSFVLLGLAWLMTNLVPFFKDMVSIIGALCGSPIMIGLPPLFYYNALRKHGQQMGKTDVMICSLLFFLLFPFTFVSGLVSAFSSLIDNWQKNGPPFSCT